MKNPLNQVLNNKGSGSDGRFSFSGFCKQDWDIKVRLIFWVSGLFLGIVAAYTTRHYINGDAITYFDMAEAFRTGNWKDATNLTYSPGYPILLALMGHVLQSSNYLFLAKGLNLLCFVLAMLACDFFTIRSARILNIESQGKSLPAPLFMAICYSAFLLSSLSWIRLQVVSPDMMVFAIILLCCLVLLKISLDPKKTALFGVLGLASGLGYIFKTFLFPFSAIFFVLAASHSRSISGGLGRISLAVGVMLLVSSPVVVGQSLMAGKLSYGEAGNYNYSYFVDGRGESIHKPVVVNQQPQVLTYERGTILTFPKGADPAYWNMGVKPVFNFSKQVSAIRENLDQLIGRVFLPFLVVLFWFFLQWRRNGIARTSLFPPSTHLMLGLISIAGTFMFCLVVMEIRYVAPFLFLGIVALAWLPRYDRDPNMRLSVITLETGFLVAVLMVILVQSLVDQSIRCMQAVNGKKSHYELFMEAKSVSDFLRSKQIGKGDKVAIVRPFNERLYWAQLAGVRITAEIVDADELLRCQPNERTQAMTALKEAGFKAVISTNLDFLSSGIERWQKPPKTVNHVVLLLDDRSKKSSLPKK